MCEACSGAEDVANEVGFMGGRHGVAAGDFDTEGFFGEPLIGDWEIDGDESIATASVGNERRRFAIGGTVMHSL